MPVGVVAQAPLGNVADVTQVDSQGSVTRVDGAPAATISGDFVTDDEGAVNKAITAQIKELEASGAIPAGVLNAGLSLAAVLFTLRGDPGEAIGGFILGVLIGGKKRAIEKGGDVRIACALWVLIG